MRYRPKSIAALHIALGGLPEKMRVEPRACLQLGGLRTRTDQNQTRNAVL